MLFFPCRDRPGDCYRCFACYFNIAVALSVPWFDGCPANARHVIFAGINHGIKSTRHYMRCIFGQTLAKVAINKKYDCWELLNLLLAKHIEIIVVLLHR